MEAQALIRDAVLELGGQLPRGWVKAFLRIEVYHDGSGGTLSAFYVPSEAPERAVHFPLSPSQGVRWRKIWATQKDDPWSTATLVVNASGRFDLDFGYEPLGEAPPFARQQKWLEENLSGYRLSYPPSANS